MSEVVEQAFITQQFRIHSLRRIHDEPYARTTPRWSLPPRTLVQSLISAGYMNKHIRSVAAGKIDDTPPGWIVTRLIEHPDGRTEVQLTANTEEVLAGGAAST